MSNNWLDIVLKNLKCHITEYLEKLKILNPKFFNKNNEIKRENTKNEMIKIVKYIIN